jgi:hypothetical protein
MPEEHPTKISEIFVNKVRLLLENNLDFTLYQTCYEKIEERR